MKRGHELFVQCYPSVSAGVFVGVQLGDWSEIERIEQIVQQNIRMMRCFPDGTIDKFSARRPIKNIDNFTVYPGESIILLNPFDRVYVYVKDQCILFGVAEHYCDFCTSVFSRSGNLQRHYNVCPEKQEIDSRRAIGAAAGELSDSSNEILDGPVTQHIYQTGKYKPKPKLLHQIRKRIFVSQNHCLIYKYFIVYDCESLLKNADESVDWITVTEAFWFSKVHQCCCISMTSNVPQYDQPTVFMAEKEQPEQFVKDFIERCLEIAKAADSEYRREIGPVFQEIDKVEHSTDLGGNSVELKIIRSLRAKLNEFCAQIPIAGWNTSR